MKTGKLPLHAAADETQAESIVDLANRKRMKKEKIGENAGIVWRILHRNDPMTFEELVKEAKLDVPDAAAAIGWLVREDKILFQEEGGKVYFTVYHEHYY